MTSWIDFPMKVVGTIIAIGSILGLCGCSIGQTGSGGDTSTNAAPLPSAVAPAPPKSFAAPQLCPRFFVYTHRTAPAGRGFNDSRFYQCRGCAEGVNK